MKFIFFKISLFSFLILLSCTNNETSKNKNSEIKIGGFLTLSGPTSSYGLYSQKGIELALQKINNSGGINGRNLVIDLKDDAGDLEKAKEIVKNFGEQEDNLAIIGQVASQIAISAAPIAQKYLIPMVSPSATNPRVTEVGEYIFRICFIDPFQGYVMAKFARENLKLKKVAVLRDRKSEYSMGLSEHFLKTFKSMGGEIVAVEEFYSGDLDFREQIGHIRVQSPEGLFIPGYYTEAALIAKQVRKMGLKTLLMGGDGWDSKKLFSIAREAVIGSYYSSHFSPQMELDSTKDFVKDFKKHYGSTPNSFAAMAFDATMVLAEAMKKSKNLTRNEIRDQLALIKNYPGVTGSISINEERNAEKPAAIVRVEGAVNRFITNITR